MDAGPHRAARPDVPRLLNGPVLSRASLVVGVALAACGPAEKKAPLPRVTVDPVTASTGPAPLPHCPGTGHWESCTVFDRLERAGLAPQRGDSVRYPFLKIAGQSWRIGAATIHVFRYRDSSSRHADFIALDSVHARPRSDTLTTWPGTPTLLVNDNLLAILLSDNGEQVERVTLALTAGPPPKAMSAAPK
jgi:hypothetical protein